MKPIKKTKEMQILKQGKKTKIDYLLCFFLVFAGHRRRGKEEERKPFQIHRVH